jgi:N-acetylglucosaminyldiphosphoundecaprenol N-acetyl-beta-D-mannosaminyltransferase
MGLDLDAFTPESLLDYLLAESGSGHGGYVMTPNLDNLYGLRHDPSLYERARGADVRVADGMPLIWASRLQGTPLPARVAGSDVALSLAQRLEQDHKSLFLLGGEEGTAERAAEILVERSPGLRIAGTYYPPHGYDKDREQLDQMLDAVRDAEPDFVYIGLPFPKASALAEELRQAVPGAWLLGIGLTFSFICGDVQRAPVWMQRIGLEWAHRLLQEPGRLARRYLIQGIPLAVRLLLGSCAARYRGPGRSRSGGRERSKQLA